MTKEIANRYTEADTIMDEVFFITDIDTPLGKELTILALQNGYTVFGTISAASEGSDEQKAEKLRAALEGKKARDTLQIEVWRRHSPVSARHVMIKALTHFNSLSHVILLGNPVIDRYDLRQVSLQQIESLVDGWVKGNFFLTKELLNHFSANGARGNLAFVCQNYKGKPSCALNEVLRAGFIGLTSSLLATADETEKPRGVIMNGFDSFQENETEYAGYIFNMLQDKAAKISGKWFKQTNGFISRLTKR